MTLLDFVPATQPMLDARAYLIAKLEEEAAAEADKKAWCDGELKENKLTREAKTAEVETITATVDAGTAGTTITNTASVTASDQADTNAANDSDSADVTVTAIDLAVTKTVDDAAPDEGGTIVYTVALTNGVGRMRRPPPASR